MPGSEPSRLAGICQLIRASSPCQRTAIMTRARRQQCHRRWCRYRRSLQQSGRSHFVAARIDGRRRRITTRTPVRRARRHHRIHRRFHRSRNPRCWTSRRCCRTDCRHYCRACYQPTRPCGCGCRANCSLSCTRCSRTHRPRCCTRCSRTRRPCRCTRCCRDQRPHSPACRCWICHSGYRSRRCGCVVARHCCGAQAASLPRTS